jgi:hypothetical protein
MVVFVFLLTVPEISRDKVSRIGNELLKRRRRKLMLLSGDLSKVCSSLTPEVSAVAAVIESCSHQFFLSARQMTVV